MILPYEWILENVGQEPMTIASKMISFRGEKVIRVGLKNHAVPVLFLVAINLGKIGMKVEDVLCGAQGSGLGPAKMKVMKKKDIGGGGSLQLFTIKLYEKIVGNCKVMFRICIGGTDLGYCYQLSDRLAKSQLWATVTNHQNLADIELIVKYKIFPVHKAILSARSRVFADEFERIQLDVPQQIRIDGVEPSTVENFLHFIYTGESQGTLADEKLLELADDHGLTTLTAMCNDALIETEATQMTKFMECLNNGAGVLYSSKIM